jgi:glycosyltransferase involved in cell wall biosynthesis
MGMGRRRAEAKDLYDEYYFDPSQNTIRDIYARADIFVGVSWDEGFGLPALEAMASGTAVATYDNGGSRDFAIDGVTALVAPRRNEELLMQEIERLIQDEALRAKIAMSGNAFVACMPTWETQTDALLHILKKS